MQFAKLTDKGSVRANNEDYCDAKQSGNYTLLVLADGMGGANSGEIASTTTVNSIFGYLDDDFLRNLQEPDIPGVLTEVISRTNSEVFNLSESEDRYKGMGTTLEICLIANNTAYIAHIGDSRVYKISRDGTIVRITKDHSLVEYMIDAGTITRADAASHPQKNVITRALGTAPSVEADILTCPFLEGDIILMCSDGLSNMLDEDTMASVASEKEEISNRAEKLVKMANDAGGNDNITVILAEY